MKVGIIGVDTPLGNQFAGFYKSQFEKSDFMTASWSDVVQCTKVLERCSVIYFIPKSTEHFRLYLQSVSSTFLPVDDVPVWIDLGRPDDKVCFDIAVRADLISLRFSPEETGNPFVGKTIDLIQNGHTRNIQFIYALYAWLAGICSPGGYVVNKSAERPSTPAWLN